jgi:predicted metalloprotease
MRFNPRARIDESQVDNREGQGGFGGGGRLPLPLPSGGGGRIGLGTVIVVVLYVVVQMCAGNSVVPGTGGSGGSDGSGGASTSCRTGADANNSTDCAIDLFTNSVQDFWSGALPQQAGKDYQVIQTVKYTGQTSSGCGAAQSAMGPFYCPNDKRVYIDQSFMRDMLQGQLGAKGGPFSQAYVLAHEYGHHVQDLLGTMSKVKTQQGATSGSVRLELQADCYAGIWTKNATTADDANGQPYISGLTKEDISRALDAAAAVGDDRIQQKTSGRVDPDTWTHGSAAERMRWFTTGMNKGTLQACDTFSASRL